jgi:hypothetical protein
VPMPLDLPDPPAGEGAGEGRRGQQRRASGAPRQAREGTQPQKRYHSATRPPFSAS